MLGRFFFVLGGYGIATSMQIIHPDSYKHIWGPSHFTNNCKRSALAHLETSRPLVISLIFATGEKQSHTYFENFEHVGKDGSR